MHQAAQPAVEPAASPPDEAALPWKEALRRHWKRRLGDCAEADEIVELLGQSLTPSTARNYGETVARFIDWCGAQSDKPSPLPAATKTVVRWVVADVCHDDKVRATSLQPYLSAINRIHRDLEMAEPALGHLVQQVRRGVALRQAGMGRASKRVYLPPPVVERVLLWALALEDAKVASSPVVRALFRAAVAVVFTFAIFCRGDTGSRLRVCDVRRSAAGVTVTLDNEKGKRVEGTARTITFPPGAVPGLEELLAKWERLRGEASGDASYFAFRHERAAARSSDVDGWLRLILGYLGEAPPAGEQWSGHSLRKGAASGASAIDVALHRICFMGGWSIQSKAVFDYIDPTCPVTPACRRFFGWLVHK